MWGRSGGSRGTEGPPGRRPTSRNFFVSLMSRHVQTLYSACRTGVLGSLPLVSAEFVLVAGSTTPLAGAAGSAPPPVGGPSLKTPCLLCTQVSSQPPAEHQKHGPPVIAPNNFSKANARPRKRLHPSSASVSIHSQNIPPCMAQESGCQTSPANWLDQESRIAMGLLIWEIANGITNQSRVHDQHKPAKKYQQY